MIDFTIIGAGITGLFTALSIKNRFPDKEVVILEQEPFCGDHTSGRNSGVLHSGIYYPTGSLKHKFCLQGNSQWRSLAEYLNIPIINCGKFIFATSSQRTEFSALKQKAHENGVAYREATSDELKEIQDYVYCDQAIYISSTGSLDTSSAIKALEYECAKKEVYILKNNKVGSIRQTPNSGFLLTSTHEEVQTKHLINCAGLESIAIRKMLGLSELEHYYVRGTYFKTYQKYFTKALLYPMPHADLKGLGVHTTFDIDNTLRFGPDTEDIEQIDYQINPMNIQKMRAEIPTVFKQIQLDKLQEDYCGIRPKIKFNGQLYPDFWIKGFGETAIDGYAELCGIESPGLTAAPAIADYISMTVGL